jgi:hypothetical protein
VRIAVFNTEQWLRLLVRVLLKTLTHFVETLVDGTVCLQLKPVFKRGLIFKTGGGLLVFLVALVAVLVVNLGVRL